MITLDSLDLPHLSDSELGELLIEAKKVYYTTGKPIMDDHTYDTLEEILRQKNPYHRLFKKVGHPNFDTGFIKKKHNFTLGSQNKVTTFEDLIHYFELKKIPNNTEFIVQPKCDGLSLEIEYFQGRVGEGITRGDGLIGDVITQNVVKMQNFIPDLSTDFTGSVRFEIVVTKPDFDTLNNTFKKGVLPPLSKGGDPDLSGSEGFYSNPRNAASGISQRLDSKYAEFCTLFAVDLFCRDVLQNVSTEKNKIDFLQSLNIATVDTYLCRSFQEIETIYQRFLTKDRQSYPFDIDGLVVKINQLSLQLSLGSHANHPKGQVAYKFPADSNQTKVLAIDWQVGPLGTVTPVAQVEPIKLSGAIITYASLANSDLVKDLDLNIGDLVEISRRGDVIPHIERVIAKVTPGHATPPLNCPVCQTPLITDHKFLKCPNSLTCPSQTLGQLRLFCQTLDIKGISAKTIEKLYTAVKIKLPGDFYQLSVNDFLNLEGLGQKSGQNIVNQIQNKKELTLIEAFHAAAIPNFSHARIKQLVDAGFDTPQKLLNISIEELENQPGIQTTLANKIFSGLQLRRPNIESILSQIKIKNLKFKIDDLPLVGKSFCITGDLSQSRKTIEALIESNGGKVSSSVSENTSYLICNSPSTSTKYLTAKKLNINIISEDDFYNLLG